MKEPARKPDGGRAASENRVFAIVLAGMGATALAAVGLSLLLDAPLGEQLRWRWADAALGLAATLPLLGLLIWFMRSQLPAVEAFRRAQIEFFSTIGFAFTPSRIALMAIGAGVSEELLFRGVLQTWAAQFLPLAFAIALPNILFGALHARTIAYAVIAGLVGCYLGALFWLTENLLAPIIAHALYDFVALDVTRRAIVGNGRSKG
ncbi:MAG: CPBP family intramembrane metalloprotease [Amphiplicatus sp.]